jgi:hypothetical protein
MRYLLDEHEKIVRRAWKDATWKRVFTVFILGSNVAGAPLALLTGNVPAAVATGVGAVAGIGRFIKCDYKPVVQATDTAPAVMLHTIRKRLDLAL